MTAARPWGWAFRSAVVIALVALSASLSFTGPSAIASRPSAWAAAPEAVSASGVASLQATSATMTGLVYVGNETASTPGGDFETMKFTMTSVLFETLALQGDCETAGPAGTALRSTTLASTAVAPSPGGMTFWATSVTGTGLPTWTPAAPPGPAGTPLGDVTVPSLVVQLVQASAPAFDIPGSGQPAGALRQYTEFCTS